VTGTEKKRGPLPIWRRTGRGMFIGRGIRVTVMACTRSTVRLGIEAPLALVVSNPRASFEDHLALQMDRDARQVTGRDLVTVELAIDESVYIGREATITYTGQDMSDRASLSVDAPLNVAVTRDDFTFEEHMRIQERREGGRR
jgi:sRNA-binding carbon storage regulator CsrA